MITVIQNNNLYKGLVVLEPEYYYRKTPKEYGDELKRSWIDLLKQHNVKFNPVFYHHNRKKDLIELWDKEKNILKIEREIIVFNLLGK